MKIGVPKEIKNHEYRVGMTPAARARADARAATRCSSRPRPATAIGLHDEIYAQRRRDDPAERRRGVRRGRHDREGEGAAAGRDRACCARARRCSPICISRPIRSRPRACSKSGAICIAYETVTDARGGLPLLAPMSEVAGPHVDPGRRALPGDGAGRARHAAGRRAGRAGGQGRGARRRRRRHQCRAHGDRAGGACHRARRLAAAA